MQANNTITTGQRPAHVDQVLYPTAGDRAGTTTSTTTAQTQQQTTATTATATGRKPLDVDMTAEHIDSYSAPTPIHLTFHLDPEDSPSAKKAAAAASNSNAIAYLHSVHPALPVAAATSSSSSTLQQPAYNRERRNSEGAAASINGQWTPMSTEQTHSQTQRTSGTVHGDQVYASEAPVIPAHPMSGSVVTTNAHDNQSYDNRARVERDTAAVAAVGTATAAATTAVHHHAHHGAGTHHHHHTNHTTVLPVTSQVERVQHVDNVSGAGRTAVAVAGVAAAGPKVLGETREVGDGGERVRRVDNVSAVTGERVAVASAAQHAMPAAQTFSSSTAPQVVMVSNLRTNTATQSTVLPPNSPAPVHGDQVYASEAPIIPPRPVHGSAASTSVHDHQYYDNHARVDRDVALAAGAAGVAGVAVASSAVAHQQVHTQPLEEARGPSVVQVADVANLQGGMHTPVLVASTASGTRVVGNTHDVGGVEQVQQVDDISRLGQAERVAVASVASRALPANQVFASTGGAQVVHTGVTTFDGTQSHAMGSAYTQRLDGASNAPSIQQVDSAAALRGTPLVLSAVAAHPMVVGSTQQVGGVERFTQVDDVSRLAQHERVAVAAAAHRPVHTSHELYVPDSAPQVVHTGVTSVNTSAQAHVMSNAYTQRLDSVSSGPQIVQVANSTAYDASQTHSVALGTAHTQRLEGTSAASVTHVDNAAALTGERLALARSAAGPTVVGSTQQVGGGQQIQQVEDVSRLGQAERVAVAGVAHRPAHTSHELYTAETTPQVVHTGITTLNGASQSAAMGTAYTQRLDNASSTSSVTQVNDASSLTGQRLDVARSAAGPLVVGSTQQVGGVERFTQVDDVSRLAQHERVAVAAAAQRPAHTSHELYTAETTPQVVHTGITTLSGATQSSTMGTAYTQRLDDEVSSTPSIVQVNNTQSLHGQRVDVGAVSTAAATTNTVRSHELSGVQTQAAQQSAYTTTQHVQQEVPVTQERTVVTREPVSAEEADAARTVRPLHQRHATTQLADGTQSSLEYSTEQPEYETRHETVKGGPVQVLHVDAAQLAGKEQLGNEAFSVAKEEDRAAALAQLSGGVKGMSLEDREQQSYRKEEL